MSMTYIVRSFRSTTTRLLLISGIVAGCADVDENLGQSQLPIYNGFDVTNLASGVVMINGGMCTGTIYSDYWVLTAAHCFSNLDTNGDGQISSTEGAGNYFVTPGPDANNNPVELKAVRIYRHPAAVWGSTEGTDTAMIWLGGSTSMGFYSQFLSTYNYTSGRLNLYSGTAAALVSNWVMSFGYAADGPERPSGILRAGYKTVVSAYSGGYAAEGIGDRGTSCPGDSGGPDYFWNGTTWSVAGIHSSGDASCTGGGDWEKASETWRSWVVQKSNTCPDRTGRGRCR